MASIVFDGVDKFFGSHQVLHDLSFRVEPGEIVGLLGPNGSGKTTTLRLIAGYYQPDAGSLAVQGVAREQAGRQPGAYVGYLPEKAPLYDSLTVLQYLRFVGRCKGLKGRPLAASVEASIAAFDLSAVTGTAIGRLSKGFRQRVGLGQAVLGDPAVLLLDEATNGLDPLQTVEARDMIRRAAVGRAVVFSSHLMQEVQALCTRAVVLRHGRLITDVSLNRSADLGGVSILLHWQGSEPARLHSALKTLDGVRFVETVQPSPPGHTQVLRIGLAERPASLNPLLACALALGDVQEIFYEDQSVEEILVNAVRESDRQASLLEQAA